MVTVLVQHGLCLHALVGRAGGSAERVVRKFRDIPAVLYRHWRKVGTYRPDFRHPTLVVIAEGQPAVAGVVDHVLSIRIEGKKPGDLAAGVMAALLAERAVGSDGRKVLTVAIRDPVFPAIVIVMDRHILRLRAALQLREPIRS